MKKNTHPQYQQILFVDSTTGTRFVIGSALKPTQTEVFEGKEYPVYQLSTSSYSHPFFTGSKQLVDAEGRVDKFKKRYMTAQQKASAAGISEDSKDESQKEEPKKEEPKKEEPKKKAKLKK